MHNNHNNNNSHNNNNLKNNYNWNNNMMANATQQQPQQQLQQQQVRISNWIYDTNRSQQHLSQNTNNHGASAIGIRHEQQQQQQQQQQYMQQQYSNYQQQNAAASTAASVNCYYAPRLPLVLQQRQQQQQQQHCHQPLLSPQQQQQHQQQQQQVQPPLHSPYAMPPQQQRQQQQQQPALTHLPHLQLQQASQPLRRIVDGIQSGVPTLTTSTLTPTTLRSIEETFIQLTNDHSNPPYQAGFIPPPINTTFQSFTDINEPESEESQTSWNNSQLNEENSLATTDTSSAATDSTSFQNGLNGMSNNSLATSTTSSKNDFTLISNAIAGEAAGKHGNLLLGSTTANNMNTSNSATNAVTPAPTRRNQGGRRPTKSTNMTPEEEEKRRIRRERNKLAAARCRKRRVDQTNELLCEVDKLEKVRETLQKEVESLKLTKNQLAYILDAHRPTCQKIRHDLLSVHTYDGLIAPANNSNSNDSTIIGVDTTLSSAGRSGSPIDLKPILLGSSVLEMVPHIKNEPLDSALDSNSSLDHDGPPSPKRMLLSSNNPMVPPALPNVATLTASLAAVASASLNTPIVSTAPVSFGSFVATPTTLTAPNKLPNGSKQRPNSLPTIPRNLAQTLALSVENKPPTDINGVAIQTPSTGMFNFDSLMDGGTGLTPVSGPLVPTCSSQNKHPLELTTPTSEPSKLVSL